MRKLVGMLAALLVAPACSLTDEPTDVASSDDALARPIRTLPAEAPPADPLYVRDTSTLAIVFEDEERFWSTWFANNDDVAELRAAFVANKPPYWEYQQKIDALVSMYDLLAPLDSGRAAKYLDRLRAIAGTLLAYRDDIRVPHSPPDYFRGKVMPAWGAITADRDYRWNTDVVTAGIFTYAMAAFARRVADRPSLFCQDYLNDAVRFTTAALETYLGFHGVELRLGSGPHAWYAAPVAYGNLACADAAYEHMCKGYRDGAGEPIAYNENLSMMRAMAETALAAESALYRSSKDGSGEDTVSAFRLFYATNEAPLLIAKNVKWFHDGLTREVWSNGAVYWKWQHQPGGLIQNTAHGGFELGSLAVIYDDKARLDAMLAVNGHAERVPLDAPTMSGFANTFLLRIWQNPANDPLYRNILAENVDGSGAKTPWNNANEGCAGFAPLSRFDPWVWVRCRDATFKARDNATSYLRVESHAALLRWRQAPADRAPPSRRGVTVSVLCSPTLGTSDVSSLSR